MSDAAEEDVHDSSAGSSSRRGAFLSGPWGRRRRRHHHLDLPPVLVYDAKHPGFMPAAAARETTDMYSEWDPLRDDHV